MKSFTKIVRRLGASFLILTCIAGGLRWYSMHYCRFPAHRIPSWSVFENFRMDRTRDDLAAATQALGNFFKHYQKLPFNRPDHEYQFSITLGHELNGVSPGLRCNNTDDIVFWNLPAGEQRDGWDNGYHFYFDHDGDGYVQPGGVLVKRPFVIWSDGPNGHDDSGEKDDIRSW